MAVSENNEDVLMNKNSNWDFKNNGRSLGNPSVKFPSKLGFGYFVPRKLSVHSL